MLRPTPTQRRTLTNIYGENTRVNELIEIGVYDFMNTDDGIIFFHTRLLRIS